MINQMTVRLDTALAQYYSNFLSENVKKSLEIKAKKHGEWCGNAPIGYLNQHDEKGRAYITIDPVRAPIVKRIFEEYATGAYTLSDMLEKAKEWGLTSKRGNMLSKASLLHMIQNPFYYGMMLFKGNLLPHRYESLISKETFVACETVRKNT